MWSSWLFLGFPSLFVCGIILAEMIELAKQSLIKADTAEHLYIVFCGIIGIGGSMMFAGVMFYIWVKAKRSLWNYERSKVLWGTITCALIITSYCRLKKKWEFQKY
jgi:hypothetical protein